MQDRLKTTHERRQGLFKNMQEEWVAKHTTPDMVETAKTLFTAPPESAEGQGSMDTAQDPTPGTDSTATGLESIPAASTEATKPSTETPSNEAVAPPTDTTQ